MENVIEMYMQVNNVSQFGNLVLAMSWGEDLLDATVTGLTGRMKKDN